MLSPLCSTSKDMHVLRLHGYIIPSRRGNVKSDQQQDGILQITACREQIGKPKSPRRFLVEDIEKSVLDRCLEVTS